MVALQKRSHWRQEIFVQSGKDIMKVTDSGGEDGCFLLCCLVLRMGVCCWTCEQNEVESFESVQSEK